MAQQQARAVAATRHVAAVLALALVTSVLVVAAGLFTHRAGAMTDPGDYGHTFAKDGVLKRGCKTYSYSYDIKPPDSGDWALEVFIYGPKGTTLASGTFMEGFDETVGSDTYRLCKPTTRPGTYRIKAKLSAGGTDNDTFEVWLPVTKYKLRKPR
jgi:hypothetical protein